MLKIQKPSEWIDHRINQYLQAERDDTRVDFIRYGSIVDYLDILHAELDETLEKLSQTTVEH